MADAMQGAAPAWKDPMPPGFSWPAGYRAAAVFTFDMDAESVILVDHPESAGWPDVMSHQAYGPRTGGKSKVSGSLRGSVHAGLDFWRAIS